MKKGLLIIVILAMALCLSTNTAKAAGTVPLFLKHVKGLLSYNRLVSPADPATTKIKGMLFPKVAECKRREWEGLVTYQIQYKESVYVLVGENGKLDEIDLLHSLAQEIYFQVFAAPSDSSDDFISFAGEKLVPISSIKTVGELEIEWKTFGIPIPEPKPEKTRVPTTSTSGG